MKKLNVAKYQIEELDSNVVRLIETLRGAVLQEEVQLVDVERILDSFGHAYFNYYGNGSFNGCASAGLLTDGRVLVVNAYGHGFLGTFVSQDKVWTRSFLLTP